MTKRATYKPSDFKRWLEHRVDEEMDYDNDTCPIALWSGERISLNHLNRLPPWVNRFTGAWDEASVQLFDGLLTGKDALRILKEIVS